METMITVIEEYLDTNNGRIRAQAILDGLMELDNDDALKAILLCEASIMAVMEGSPEADLAHLEIMSELLELGMDLTNYGLEAKAKEMGMEWEEKDED